MICHEQKIFLEISVKLILDNNKPWLTTLHIALQKSM